MKYRLTELIKEGKRNFRGLCPNCDKDNCEECENAGIADWLLENGVIVPPCKVGDKLYYISYRSKDGKAYVKEKEINTIMIDRQTIWAGIPRALLIDLADLGTAVFLSREEAERALKERSNK